MKGITRIWVTLFLVFFSFFIVSQSLGIEINETKLLPKEGAVYRAFGYSVAISGDYAVIGQKGNSYDDIYGSAYIFKKVGDNWIQQAELLPNDREDFIAFGTPVAISGDYAVIGARGDNDNGNGSGSAYIFQREGDGWIQKEKLLANDAEAFDNFGNSVAISGDHAVIGAGSNDDNGNSSGSAYIFQREGDGWIQKEKLLANDAEAFDNFGNSVAISGDHAVVGATGGDDNGNGSGSAYIFQREGDGWVQKVKLLANDGSTRDYFGNSVAISGNYVVIGAHGEGNNGSAYIFEREDDIWVQKVKLLASDGQNEDGFGYSISISGDYAVVGATGGDDNGYNSGSAYIFERESDIWVQKAKLLASDASSWDLFGNSVAISGNYVVIGAYGDNSPDGSAYLKEIEKVHINLSNVAGGAVGLEGTWRIDVYDALGEAVDQYYSTSPSVGMALADGDYTAKVYFLYDDGMGIWEYWGEIEISVVTGNETFEFTRNMPWLGIISPWKPTISSTDSSLVITFTLTNELPTSLDVMFEGQLAGGNVSSSGVVTIPGDSSTDVTFQFNDIPSSGIWPFIYWVKVDPTGDSVFIPTDHSVVIGYLTIENESYVTSDMVYMDYQDQEENLWQIGVDWKNVPVEMPMFNPQDAFKNVKTYKNGVSISPSTSEMEVLLNRVAHHYNRMYPAIYGGEVFDSNYGIWRAPCSFSWACRMALINFSDSERLLIYKDFIWDGIMCRNHPYLNMEYRVPNNIPYFAPELPLSMSSYIDNVWDQYSEISGVNVKKMNRMKKILLIAEKAEEDPDLQNDIKTDCKQLGKVVSMLQTANKVGNIATETIENILIMEFLASTGFGEQRLATLKEAYYFVKDNIEDQIDPILLEAIEEVEAELDSNTESLGNTIVSSFLNVVLDPEYVRDELVKIAAGSKLSKKLVSGVAKNLKISKAAAASVVMDGIKALKTIIDLGDDWRRSMLSSMLSKTVVLYAQKDQSWRDAAYPANDLVTYENLMKHQIRDVYDLNSVFAFEYLSRGLAFLDSSWTDVLEDAIDSTLDQAASPPYAYSINYASTAVLFGKQVGSELNKWVYNDAVTTASDLLMSTIDMAERKNKAVNQWAIMLADSYKSRTMPWIPLLLLND